MQRGVRVRAARRRGVADAHQAWQPVDGTVGQRARAVGAQGEAVAATVGDGARAQRGRAAPGRRPAVETGAHVYYVRGGPELYFCSSTTLP